MEILHIVATAKNSVPAPIKAYRIKLEADIYKSEDFFKLTVSHVDAVKVKDFLSRMNHIDASEIYSLQLSDNKWIDFNQYEWETDLVFNILRFKEGKTITSSFIEL